MIILPDLRVLAHINAPKRCLVLGPVFQQDVLIICSGTGDELKLFKCCDAQNQNNNDDDDDDKKKTRDAMRFAAAIWFTWLANKMQTMYECMLNMRCSYTIFPQHGIITHISITQSRKVQIAPEKQRQKKREKLSRYALCIIKT